MGEVVGESVERCMFVLQYIDVGVGAPGIPEYCDATEAEHAAHPDWDHVFVSDRMGVGSR